MQWFSVNRSPTYCTSKSTQCWIACSNEPLWASFEGEGQRNLRFYLLCVSSRNCLSNTLNFFTCHNGAVSWLRGKRSTARIVTVWRLGWQFWGEEGTNELKSQAALCPLISCITSLDNYVHYCVSNFVGGIQLHLHVGEVCSTHCTGSTQKYLEYWGFSLLYLHIRFWYQPQTCGTLPGT